MIASVPAVSPAQPRRALGFSGLVAVTFFCVAGGAYGLEDAVGAAGPLLVLVMMGLLPWLWSLPTALMTAELSAALPEDGGYVVWVERAFGRFWAFQEGWLSWLCSFADNALYPVMFLDYLAYLRGDMPPWERWIIGSAMISFVTWLNVRGIRLVGAASIFFAALILAPFIVMVVIGAPQVQPERWLGRTAAIDWALLLSTLLWNTSGWDNAGCCAGEVKSPERTYARALVVSVLIVTLVYLLPLAVGVSADSHWADWKEGYFPKVAAQIGGSWLGIWLTVTGLVSAAGMFNALLCTSARVPFAMARRGMLPELWATLHPRFATPWYSIVVNSIGVAALIPFSFQELIEVDMFLYAVALILEFAALIWLRVRQAQMKRPYRIPLGTPGIVAISVPPMLLCCASILLSNEMTKYVSLGGIAVGLVVYYLRFKPSGESEIEPTPTAGL